ncbi:MAG: carboxypeptidase-like regulatory domain-containing protein [Candidatus Thermoplasmatota archaeon]|jgi:hypothetical protein
MRPPVVTALLLPALLAGMAGCLGDETPLAVPTGQIDGAVVDQLLRPFANQTVYLSPLGLTDATSPLGGFTFRGVPVGTYTLLTAHPGTQGSAAVVEVEAGRITKVILQLMPTPVRDPHVAVFPPHSGFEDLASPQTKCVSCAWTVPLAGDERPAEIVFDWHWETSPLGDHGNDGMLFEVMDDKGDLLFRRDAASSPFSATIDGADIPSDARELQVQVYFGPAFTPRANFRLESYVTAYYGATSDELFTA